MIGYDKVMKGKWNETTEVMTKHRQSGRREDL